VRGTLSYEIVLVHGRVGIVAHIDELHVRAEGKSCLEVIEAVTEKARRVLAMYAEDDYPLPNAARKVLVPIELPRPSSRAGRPCGRAPLRLVGGGSTGGVVGR
jgi:hypothetical protein